MGLTSLPLQVDGELGVDKVDRVAPRDRVHTVPADEYNALKNAVAGMVQALGLGDGSTADSLEAVGLAVNAPVGRPGRMVVVDDFIELLPDRWFKVDGSSNAILSGASAVAKANGAGILELLAVSEGEEAAIIDGDAAEVRPWFNGWNWPRIRARIRTPNLGAPFIIGMGDDSDASAFGAAATITPTASGWDCETIGASGTETNSAQGSAPTTGTWYDIAIELDGPEDNGEAGVCRFYVDGALISTISDGTKMPSGDNSLARYFGCHYGTVASAAYVDWCQLELTRR